MKIIYRSCFSFFFFFAPGINAQEIDWDKISFGAFTQFSATDGDLNKFWGNFFSAGILVQYEVDEKSIFELAMSGSYLEPEENNRSTIPNIILINSQALVKYNLITKEFFSLNVSPGFTNTTFIFTGLAADKVDDNNIEHEFGVYFSSGIEFIIKDNFRLETYLSGQNVLSSPVNLVFYTFGLKFIYK